ncbi:MAG: hypothetical protein ABL994_10735 [Verrucomicrobiales bacterium]
MTRILYCRCAFAQVVPEPVKDEVLRGLSEAGCSFETVPDLCEMSARKDPALAALVSGGPLRIVACYPRAVKWLLHNAGATVPEGTDPPQVLNMREESSESILDQLLQD